MDSTGFFIQVLQYLNVKAKIFFLPNNMRTAVRYETKEQVVDILKQVGFVTDEIPASVAMERINTLAISNECIDKVKNCLLYTSGKIKLRHSISLKLFLTKIIVLLFATFIENHYL